MSPARTHPGWIAARACATAMGLAAGWGFLGGGAVAQMALVNGGARYALGVVTLRDIPFRTIIRQRYDYSCGSAALATLLHYHFGEPVGEAEVFQAMYAAGDQERIRQVGFSLLDMKHYLAGRGYQADGYRVSLDQLENARTPGVTVIQLNGYRHFVVIKGVRKGRVLVGDPAAGLRTYSRGDFAKIWTGVVFAIHDASAATAAFNRREEWRPWAAAPLGEPLGESSLAAFSRELPPLYQVTLSRTAAGPP